MPMFLLPENVARQDGFGADCPLGAERGKPLLITLGITRSMEQESLEIAIWGSANRKDWKLLQVFPLKFYCGTYSLVLDLTQHPEVRHLRASWKMNRWGGGDPSPLFGFYLMAEEAREQAVGAY
ncbi:MAG TPA: hypothetical protein VKX39_07475 [Bryobacteraceae bacterium]|jgi:hypothetical protein|nr:hypothetical protein [Bryobacteraceae bacterium]